MTDAEFERQYRIATKRGEERLRKLPLATRVRYHLGLKRIVIDLNNGCSMLIPPRVLQGLASASEIDRAKGRVLGLGTAIEWPKLDLQFSVEGLLAGRLGGEQWMKQLAKKRVARRQTKMNRSAKAKSA